MLSKWLPWDFIKNHPDIILEDKKGLYAFYPFDTFMEKYFLDRLRKKIKASSQQVITMIGPDITVDWLESNIQTRSFFSSDESYVVLQAENIPTQAKTYIIENKLDLDQRFFVLSFSKKVSFFEQLTQVDAVHSLVLEAPRFWEGNKYLEFLCQEFKMKLPYDVQNYIVDSLELRSDEYISLLRKIALEAPKKKKIELSWVQELISTERLDFFNLASLYGQKKKEAFFKRLLSRNGDFETLRSLFSFMQGHLARLADTSYINKKARPSKYDKEILGHRSLWTEEEIIGEMVLFGKMEIEAKKKSLSLINDLRSLYLKQIS